jgi:hypothetical protein
MFSLTPQSLHRNGIHHDDGHTSAREAMHAVHRHLLLVKDITDVAAKNQEALRRDSYGDDSTSNPPPWSPVQADPNAGYGPGALAQKPTARQPPGNQAMNAPARSSSGGSDPAAADPVGPQPKGSKQFTTWDEVLTVTELALPRQATAYDWDDLTVLIEFSAQTAALERTPAPIGQPGGPGLYHVKGLGHADYFQQVRNGLMKRGVPEGRAHAMTWSILRRWAAGGGHVHPEVQAAARKALAQEAAASAKAHAHAVSWDDLDAVIEMATVIDLFNPAQPRLPVGPGGGQFAPASGAQQGAAGQQQAKGKAPAKQPAKPPLTAHQQHVAHVAHQMKVSTQKAELLVTAQNDKAKASALIKQRDALAKGLASASGKVSSGQAGAKTTTTAKTKTTAPAASKTASTGTTASTKTATTSSATKKTAVAAPKAGSAAAVKAQIAQLNLQINSLLQAAAQASAQAAKMQ